MNTDTERLDFIEKNKYDVQFYGKTGSECCCEESTGQFRVMGRGNTPREAIDAAILTTRTGKANP